MISGAWVAQAEITRCFSRHPHLRQMTSKIRITEGMVVLVRRPTPEPGLDLLSALRQALEPSSLLRATEELGTRGAGVAVVDRPGNVPVTRHQEPAPVDELLGALRTRSRSPSCDSIGISYAC
jgi:hypothetical protein